MNSTFGFWLIVVGYLLAIWGGWLLYSNAPHDIPAGTLPRMPGAAMRGHFENAWAGVRSRAWWSRIGFLLLTLGGGLQLAGVVVQWYWPTR